MHALFLEELPYDPNQVTPGVIGFAVTAIVAVAVMLLMWDFNRRVRRINDREEAKERLLAEMAAAQGSTAEDGGAVQEAQAAETERGASESPDDPRA
ncbi:hypothetical protein SAMN04487783_1829 [Agrococcus baldri]|uniref:Uncharacterized protein n=1 Tax=Agrococcus baldri TaxID=153730 RepID=A0AA94KZV5_9MICO|nr:hypothetical protein [Agrococcus baldri]SFS14376.1 hypothetical protein SAMN04487783_1829 [Agrococcus baldri]